MSGEQSAPTPADITWTTVIGAKATPRSGSAVGVKTAWELTPSGDKNLDVKFVDPSRRSKLVAATVTGTEDGWSNGVNFAPASGETYRLTAKSVGANEVIKDMTIVTQQRLPLTVYYVDAAALRAWESAFALVKKAYEDVGIVLDVKKKVKTDKPARPLYKGVDPTGEDWMRQDLAKFFNDGKLPPVNPDFGHLRVFVLGKLEQYLDANVEIRDIGREHVVLGDMNLLAIPEGSTGVKLAPSPVLEAELDFGVMAGSVDIKSKVTRLSDTHLGFPFSRAFVNEHFREGSSRTATLKVKWELVEAGFLGWSDGKNLLVVATKNKTGQALPAKTVARIAIHEIGHSLGQVVTSRKEYPGGDVGNGLHYEGMGGTGHHCKKDPENVKDEGGKLVWRQGTLCVMYHDGGMSPKADAAFCDNCKINLRLVDLGLLGPRQAWPR